MDFRYIEEHWTPGVVFLLNTVPRLLAPSFVAAVDLALFERASGAHLPSWLWFVACSFALPAFLYVRGWIRWIEEERERIAFGAVRAPVLKGKWPGNIDVMLKRLRSASGGYPLEEVDEFVNKVGKIFSIDVMGETRIVSCDPNHIKTMLATDFAHWEKGPVIRFQALSIFGSGVFNADGELWKFHRTLTRPYFARDRITDFETFGRHADVALTAIRTAAASGAALDFQDLIFRFTLDSATEFLFGSCVHSLYAVLPGLGAAERETARKADVFALAIARVQRLLATRSRMSPLWPLKEIFRDKTREDMASIQAFIEPLVQDAVERKRGASEKDVEASRLTLLDELTDVTDDKKVIFDETFNILLAGRDTTAGTLTFMVYLLAQHPHVLAKLREEVLAKVGPARYPDFDGMREMKYLRAVINETLRLYPSVPANTRSPTKSTTLPPLEPGGRPFYVPKGSRGQYVVMHMHRDKHLWGPDAELFDPERFLDARLAQYVVPNPFVFLPFNAGPRICLGQQFAYNEMSFFAVRLLQQFDRIELALDAQPPESLAPLEWKAKGGRKAQEALRPKSELTMYIQGGLWVRFGEAEKTA